MSFWSNLVKTVTNPLGSTGFTPVPTTEAAADKNFSVLSPVENFLGREEFHQEDKIGAKAAGGLGLTGLKNYYQNDVNTSDSGLKHRGEVGALIFGGSLLGGAAGGSSGGASAGDAAAGTGDASLAGIGNAGGDTSSLWYNPSTANQFSDLSQFGVNSGSAANTGGYLESGGGYLSPGDYVSGYAPGAGVGATNATSVGGAMGAGTSLGSNGWLQAAQTGFGALASLYSAKVQADAAKQAAATTAAQNAQTRADMAPWRVAGADAVGQMSLNTQPGGYFTHQFDANDLNANMAPNYAFQLGQGQQALNNQASVGGSMLGGNAMTAMQKYTQDTAAGAYQQAYQNYTANQTNIFNRLSAIAGLGQTANQATAQYGAMNNQIGTGYSTSAAAANAAGIVGTANAANNGLNNYLGWNYLNSQHP